MHFVCVDIILAPKDPQLKLKVSPGIAALHSNNPVNPVDLCMQVGPSHCHIVRGREHDDISQSQGEERENRMSPGGSRCRERNERSPNMTGFTAVSKSLLHLVHQSFCCTTFPPPVKVHFKSPSHWHFVLPSSLFLPPPLLPLLHHRCPPL